MRNEGADDRRGFSLIELLVVIAIIALLLAILLPALAGARRAGRQAVCMSNLQELGRAHHTYGNDFKDFVAALNGLAEERAISSSIHYGVPVFPQMPHLARQAAKQLREQTNRDLNSVLPLPEFSPVTSAIDVTMVPMEQFSHVVLFNYMGSKQPMPVACCPEDKARLNWRANPLEISKSLYKPKSSYNLAIIEWLPYSSSYQLLPTAWSKDGRGIAHGPTSDVHHAIFPGSLHFLYGYHPKRSLAGRKYNEIYFPSLKAAVADSQQRHDKRDLYYAFPEAKQPLLFWDGSVNLRATHDANQGWSPKEPNTPRPATITYAPDIAFESVANSNTKVTGYYKWTRGGLSGVDFDGNEIDTSKW